MYTKIVCTIGPVSESKETLKNMAKSGMRVARLNFSHGTYPSHKKIIGNVRSVAKDLGLTLGIMQDLQGPKIRIGDLKKPLVLKKGQTVVLGKDLPMQYDLSKIVLKNQTILIDDGAIELKVKNVKKGLVECLVIVPGTVIAHKGINVPESKTNFSVFTDKDKKDLIFGLKNNVDFVAMSFVRSARDIEEVRKFIQKRLKRGATAPWIVAKIEKKQAITNLKEIVNASDAIMVARGDLGIEAPEELVPVYQKTIIKEARNKNKPVIVATQMLDSMIRNPRPTRAEVSDVANAVFDHTDCVMLSGESAFGKYPKQAVKVMGEIITASERSYFDNVSLKKKDFINDALFEIMAVAKKENAPIVLKTPVGISALELSSLHQEVPVIVYSSSQEVAQRLSMVWGIIPRHMPKLTEKDIIADLKKNKLVGSQAVFVQCEAQKNNEILVSAQLKKTL